jgi:hypothetical protein
MKCAGAIIIAFLLCAPSSYAYAQNKNCKFLNESCNNPTPKPKPRTDPQLSDEEHLRRCLADWVRSKGGFAPEGQGTGAFPSRSEVMSGCRFAIKNHNYYWSYPANPDVEANMRCCLNSGTDRKACQDNIAAAKRANLNLDFCYIASKAGEPPPPEMKVPAGCTGGPCSITPGYCKYVGYTDMDRSVLPVLIAAMRESMVKYPATADTSLAILRVCFGIR